MWCANCRADVAAEVTADNRRIQCATCGGDIGTSETISATTKTREARELLERWSNASLLDPFGPLPDARKPAGVSRDVGDSGGSSTDHADSLADPTFRIDGSHPLQAGSPSEDSHSVLSAHLGQHLAAGSRRPTENVIETHSMHTKSAHSSAAASHPHFDAQAELTAGHVKKSSWTSTLGQLLAYGGVALLTVGTTLVLWGYFGGPAGYAPTGWLITTAGQMLLFLGVITLVSGGMEQTTAEVARRIDTLGEKIIRIERATLGHTLRGPSLPAEHFAEQESARRARTPPRDRLAS